jgi:hypothetical protein
MVILTLNEEDHGARTEKEQEKDDASETAFAAEQFVIVLRAYSLQCAYLMVQTALVGSGLGQAL